jgi:hypothetical protein
VEDEGCSAIVSPEQKRPIVFQKKALDSLFGCWASQDVDATFRANIS